MDEKSVRKLRKRANLALRKPAHSYEELQTLRYYRRLLSQGKCKCTGKIRAKLDRVLGVSA